MPDQELGRREKEIISVGASVAAGCQPCARHHVIEARAAGATEQQMRLAVDDALCVRRNATDVIAGHAEGLLGEVSTTAAACCPEKSMQRELTSVSAAFAVNCPVNLARHVDAARRRGATERQIQTAVGLARTIKRVAGGHVEDAADPTLAETAALAGTVMAETEPATVSVGASRATSTDEGTACCG